MPGFQRVLGRGQPPCPHEAEFGEGVQWPDDVSLAHFDNCLTPDGRAQLWHHVRVMADRATTCTLQDHAGLQGAVRVQVEYIRQQTAKLRELEGDLKRSYPDAAPYSLPHIVIQRVEAILGLVVSEEGPPG